jgi:hypothetical protein
VVCVYGLCMDCVYGYVYGYVFMAMCMGMCLWLCVWTSDLDPPQGPVQ